MTKAAEWLLSYLRSCGGSASSQGVRDAGAADGHNYDALKRARRSLEIATASQGFPRRTYWSLPDQTSPGQVWPQPPRPWEEP
jgi:hypothetical protein